MRRSARYMLGAVNTALALGAVYLFAFVWLIAAGPVSPGAPSSSHVALKIGGAEGIALLAAALFTRAAFVSLRGAWRLGWQLAPFAAVAALAAWLSISTR